MDHQKWRDNRRDDLRKVRDKVKEEFLVLTTEQIRWKPSPSDWSVGECLQHLMIVDAKYLEQIEAIKNGTYQPSFWVRWSLFSWFWGWMFRRMIQPEATTKIPAPRDFRPSYSDISGEVVSEYLLHLDRWERVITELPPEALDRKNIVSPISDLITLRLGDAVISLMDHEERHIRQALRVMGHAQFPGRPKQ